MDQDYYWTPEWQEGEREADRDIETGRVTHYNTAEDLIEYLHKVTKQQEIQDETNKLIDRCYTKGRPGLMVFQRQKFLNELFPLLDRLDVVVRVDRVLPEVPWMEHCMGVYKKCQHDMLEWHKDSLESLTEGKHD